MRAQNTGGTNTSEATSTSSDIMWESRFLSTRNPKVRSRVAHDDDSCNLIEKKLREKFNLVDYTIDVEDYRRFIQTAEIYKSNRYYGGYDGQSFPEKTLEHYLAAKLLNLGSQDIYIDIASQNSPVPSAYSQLYGCKTWRQDLAYPPGINGDTIGGDASAMPLENNFATAMALHCSFEHFEGDADIRFIKEVLRVLRPGGKCVILPLYLASQYSIQTDPLAWPAEGMFFEPDAVLHCVQNFRNRHGRFYDIAHLKSRIIDHLDDLKCTIINIKNAKDVHQSCYARFAMILEKPKICLSKENMRYSARLSDDKLSIMKTLFIFGTRPEAIKMAPIIKKMLDSDGAFDIRICVTGQHRQMLDEVLHIFGIRPDYDLGLMKENQSLATLTAACISTLDAVIAAEKPDWVLVQGDTTTAMTGALAAHYHRIKVAHVEAGLRTGDKFHPFPEETNRRMIASIADIHFAPSRLAADNLIAEGIDKSSIHIVGNTSIDAMRIALDMTHDLDKSSLATIPFDAKRIILVTAHRRESFGEPIKNICRAIKTVAACNSSNVHIVYPVHMNPNIAEPVHQLLGGIENITLLEPLDYVSFIHLLNRSYIVLTDSGGLQEEAPSLGKPVLVLRKTTERIEAIHAGTACLVGTNPATIIAQVENLLCDQSAYASMAKAANPYGDGDAAQRIRTILHEITVRGATMKEEMLI